MNKKFCKIVAKFNGYYVLEQGKSKKLILEMQFENANLPYSSFLTVLMIMAIEMMKQHKDLK